MPLFTPSARSLIASETTVALQTQVTFLNIPQSFEDLWFVFDNLQHTHGSNQSATIEVSANNGSTWSSAMIITLSAAASVVHGGWLWLPQYSLTIRKAFVRQTGNVTGANSATSGYTISTPPATSPINAARFGHQTSAVFATGTVISMYGVT